MRVDTRLLDAIMLLVQFRISFAEFPVIGSRVGSVLDVALGVVLWRITDAAIQSAIPESFPNDDLMACLYCYSIHRAFDCVNQWGFLDFHQIH